MEEKLKDMEFAQWLEDVIRSMFELNPDKMCFVAHTPAGETMTAYFNANAEDMAAFAHHINSDVIMEIVTKNAGMILDAAADPGYDENDD